MLKQIASYLGRLGVLIIAQAFLATAAIAGIDEGKAWLLSSQQTDGSITSATSRGNAFQNTAEALDTFQLIGGVPGTASSQALAFLDADAYTGSSYIAQRVYLRSSYGMSSAALATDLYARQDESAAIGEFPHYQSTTLDTAHALMALDAASSLNSQDAAYMVGILLSLQLSDGGWALSGTTSNTLVTAHVVRALAAYRTRFTMNAELSRATAFLLGQRVGATTWVDTLTSASAIQALMSWVADPGLLTDAANYLRDQQTTDGSWENDVITTAVALRALWLADARAAGGNGVLPSTGGLSGRVVDAVTGEPLVGVNASLVENPGISVSSAQNGEFLLTGLEPGTYTVRLSKAGYTGVSAVIVAASRQVVDLGEVALGVIADSAIFKAMLFDSNAGQPIPGVQVELTGPVTYRGMTDGSGQFEQSEVVPGNYNYQITHPDYQPVGGSAVLTAGVVSLLKHGLLPVGNAVIPGPVVLTGTVRGGASGEWLAGVQVSLDGSAVVETDANGAFAFPGVSPGQHQLVLSHAGYSPRNYTVNLPEGAAGNIGELLIYPAPASSPPDSLTLIGRVSDAVTGEPLAGVNVRMVQSGETLLSDQDGGFVLSGVTLQQFDLELDRAGYLAQTATVTVSAFGEAAVAFALQPQPDTPAPTFSTISGQVTDLTTGLALAGVQVHIPELGLSATTAADGSYSISVIPSLAFTVDASLLGYQSRQYDVSLGTHGLYDLPVRLEAVLDDQALTDPAVQPVFQVLRVSPIVASLSIDSELRIQASIGNLSSDGYEVQVIGEVQNAEGAAVATISSVLPSTTDPLTSHFVAGGATQDVELVWNTARTVPGSYRIVVRVVEPGSISRALPTGVVYASGFDSVLITPSARLGGFIELSPPMAQAGLGQPVDIKATLLNQGNVPLLDQVVELTVHDETTDAVVFSKQLSLAELSLEGHRLLEFGGWEPTQSGNLPVRIRPLGAVDGQIETVLYVGDRPTGQFTLASNVTPEGTHTIRAMIDLQGVDVTEGSVSDPLFGAVQQAVETGGIYVAREGVAWHKRSRCLGCHIQTQSVYGLASSVNKAPIDQIANNFLFNTINSALQNDGVLTSNHSSYRLTQTALGAWALTAWPDQEKVFRSLFKAAGYFDGHRSTSGDRVYWRPDHVSGWWRTNDATTALVTTSMAALVRMAEELDPVATLDYDKVTHADAIDSGMRDVEVGPDGAFYVITTGGEIRRVDAELGSSGLWLNGIGSSALGLAFDDQERVYVSTARGEVYRVNVDLSVERLMTGGGELNDIEFGPDGLLYVSDRSRNRIYRFDPASPALNTWVSGSGLNGPYGLDFTTDGRLLVANHSAYNILAIDLSTRQMSVLGDGLSYRPLYLSRDLQGDVYYTSLQQSTAGLTGPYALNRLDSQGLVERLVSGSLLRGVLTHGDKVFFVDESARRLYRLTAFPLNRSKLSTYRNRIDAAGRYLLSRSGGSELIERAMLLTGLGEVYSVSADEPLKAQALTAMNRHADYLRANQRSDGGWGRYVGGSSDPMVTALVGLALEYTDPSPDDPQVRAAILYLLGSQQSDYSWRSTNNILNTRLAATSLVMAYLPEALERLGGIDVDLRLRLPANIGLSNASRVPDSAGNPDGSSDHNWRLLGVTSEGRNVSFDLTFHDMLLDEERLAARSATVEFENSFTGELLSLPLDIPRLRAISGVALSVSTDKTSYGVNEEVQITAVVTNASPGSIDGQLRMGIYPAGSDQLLASLPAETVSALPAGSTQTLSFSWPTGRVLTGALEARGVLVDSRLRELAKDDAAFAIHAPAVVLAGSVRTDKPVYDAWDSVRIDGQVINRSLNAIQGATLVVIEVKDPSGGIIHRAEQISGQLVPQAIVNQQTILALNEAGAGVYPVELKIYDRYSRVLLAAAQTSFTVEQQHSAIVGEISATPTEVPLGRSVTCVSSLSNRSATAITGQALRVNLVDAETGISQSSHDTRLDIAANQTVVWTNITDTRSLGLKDYLCVLEAEYQGAWQTLDVTGFRVILSVEGELTTDPAGGRLLVLMDEPPRAGGDGHERPTAAPSVEAQRSYLQDLLTASGWSYTIVTDSKAFRRELRSGTYTVYALLSEAVKLSGDALEELRAAVGRGHGLLVAGMHDSRNMGGSDHDDDCGHDDDHKDRQVRSKDDDEDHHDKACRSGGDKHGDGDQRDDEGRDDEDGHDNPLAFLAGLKLGGNLPKATGLHVLPTQSLGEQWLDFTSDRKRIVLEPVTAEVLAEYVPIHSQKAPAASITLNHVGTGKVVTTGFDLLAESALQPVSRFGQLMLNVLDAVRPEVNDYHPGDVVPLLLHLRTLAPEVSGQVRLQLPTGVQAIDPGLAMLQGDELVWDYQLFEDMQRSFRFWLSLPADGVYPTYLDARVFIDFDGTLVEHTAFDLLLLPVAYPSLDTLRAEVAMLALSDRAYREVAEALDEVAEELAKGDDEEAIEELLEALRELGGINTPQSRALADQLSLLLEQISRQWWLAELLTGNTAMQFDRLVFQAAA